MSGIYFRLLSLARKGGGAVVGEFFSSVAGGNCLHRVISEPFGVSDQSLSSAYYNTCFEPFTKNVY